MNGLIPSVVNEMEFLEESFAKTRNLAALLCLREDSLVQQYSHTRAATERKSESPSCFGSQALQVGLNCSAMCVLASLMDGSMTKEQHFLIEV